MIIIVFGAPVCATWILLAFSEEKWVIFADRFAMGAAATIPYMSTGQ
jgi:hypothetical protein